MGVIRVSGAEAIALVQRVFSKSIREAKGYTLHYGQIFAQKDATRAVIDEVLLSVFRAPRSFTKEDVVEISCHGSPYILRTVLGLLLENGCRLAEAGEFTQRAYLNGAMDLAQAEAIADLIASNSEAAHRLAMNQLRGGVSNELAHLREQLLNFSSLIELELDFAEEDVEFADRTAFRTRIAAISATLESLIGSFAYGNAVKQGVPTAIIGKPNAGKSTLLNALLNENRAIVSDIPGTTRDVIEDRLTIQGIEFRLMDTAGLRQTADAIEAEGVSRSLALAQSAALVLYVFDATIETLAQAAEAVAALALPEAVAVLFVGNKTDIQPAAATETAHSIFISAKEKHNLPALREAMTAAVETFAPHAAEQAIISNTRHLNALQRATTALQQVQSALAVGLSADLLAIDLRTAIHHIGSITGAISNDEVLGNIFSKFCIGK